MELLTLSVTNLPASPGFLLMTGLPRRGKITSAMPADLASMVFAQEMRFASSSPVRGGLPHES